MHNNRNILVAAVILAAAIPQFAVAGFTGKPLFLSAEDGASAATWVAYESGDLLRCTAKPAQCQTLTGTPGFASPVSLSAVPGKQAAWVGWSDGSLTYCSKPDGCISVMPAGGP